MTMKRMMMIKQQTQLHVAPQQVILKLHYPTLLYTHLSVVAATYHINSSPSPLSSGLQILKQLAVEV